MPIDISDIELQQFKDIIYKFAALTFTTSQTVLLKKRLIIRMEMSKFDNAKEYYRFISQGINQGEMLKLIDLITVNETYFFREDPQIELIQKDLLPKMCRSKRDKNDKSLRMWCAASSSGEEPYTLGILVKETGLFNDPSWQIEIHGSDINSEVLVTAEQGLYGRASFRNTSEKLKSRYFMEEEAEKFRVIPSIKRMTKFSRVNLNVYQQVASIRNIDMALCRNLLIYFDKGGKKKVVENIYSTLKPGGIFLIGQSESLMQVEHNFETVTSGSVVYYRKPE